jgi:23S rRNA pseudouridine2605 synthase
VQEKNTRRSVLARALSKLGYCSRSRAAELIRAGRVRLNGRLCRDADSPVRIERDQIVVDDLPIQTAKKIYLMMNKPRGVVTTASDEKGRETVYDLLEKSGDWVAPVGRLDKASEGLLLLTNDSEWGALVAAPETHLEKTYHVQIAALADQGFLQALLRGVSRIEGTKSELLRARRAKLLRGGQKNCWLEIVLDEGKNRQIRSMMAVLGVDVLRLVRVAIGPLQLGKLAKGRCRSLTADEKRSLNLAMRDCSAPAKVVAHG